MSDCPIIEDLMLTTSSGELVPKATIVRPITSGDIPIIAASLEAPRTSDSAPISKNTSPTINRMIVIGSKSVVTYQLNSEKAIRRNPGRS